MKKNILFAIALVLTSAVAALADDSVLQSSNGSASATQVALMSLANTSRMPQGITRVRDSHSHFVGCARSHKHCHHLASHKGYHHASVQYDEERCHHHPHLACYAWN